jgi:exodeoxyribonuclease VII small subunit
MTKKAKGKTEEEVEQFDVHLERLRTIVERLEQGDLKLEESLRLFEEGVGISRRLTDVLSRSEAKVEELLSTMERVRFEQPEE